MSSFLQHLDYADNICLFAHKIPEFAAMFKSLEVVAASVSVTINCRKTKTLSSPSFRNQMDHDKFPTASGLCG